MANKQQQMQHLIGMYIEETGKTEVDMKEVAKFAVERVGWQLATPESPLDRLAKEFSRAAREVMRHDKDTGKPYRAYHMLFRFPRAERNFIFGLILIKLHENQCLKVL